MISTMALSAAVVSFLNGYLTHFVRPSKLICRGLGGYAGGLVVLGSTGSPVIYTLGLVLLGCGHGLSNPSLNTELVSLVPARLRGGVMSSRTVMARLGQTTGPFLASLLGGLLGYSRLLMGAGMLCLLVMGLVLMTAQSRRFRRKGNVEGSG